MLVMTLLSRTSDDTAESVLVITHQGTTSHSQRAAIDRQGATADSQCVVSSHQGVVVDRQGAVTDRRDVGDLVASRRKKALATRCVDHGGHQSRCMDLHAFPKAGASFDGL
jgi:hypothetical protein